MKLEFKWVEQGINSHCNIFMDGNLVHSPWSIGVAVANMAQKLGVYVPNGKIAWLPKIENTTLVFDSLQEFRDFCNKNGMPKK